MSSVKGTVADHYNQLQSKGIEERKKSRIYYLRNFNNWVKSVSINEALQHLRRENYQRNITAMDLCCGKGGDFKKWQIGRIRYLVCADLAETSVEQAKERYEEMKNNPRNRGIFGAEFIAADCAEVRLSERYKNPNQRFDLVSCQFSFHYSFESYERAERMLANACERLEPGGLFIGTIPDAHEIMKRLDESGDNRFGNDIYSITFESKDTTPLFGARYHFYLQEVVDCPEFLVNFSLLHEMAKKFGMKLLQRYTFEEFFEEYSKKEFYRNLAERMDAMETFPSDNLVGPSDDYEDVKKRMQAENLRSVGCLSKSEWEAASLYIVFVFQKEGEPSQQSSSGQSNRDYYRQPHFGRRNHSQSRPDRRWDASSDGTHQRFRNY